jgi:hypothetical protein
MDNIDRPTFVDDHISGQLYQIINVLNDDPDKTQAESLAIINNENEE